MPTPEYCLLWIDWWPLCMTKSEWSGWAQAVGAIIALAIAIGLPVKARRDAYRDAKDMAKTYASQLALISQDFVKACENQQWAKFEAHRHSLADACTIAQIVPISMLRGSALAAYMTLRSEAIEIHTRSAVHTAGGHWQHWRKEFVDFHNSVLLSIDVIHNSW